LGATILKKCRRNTLSTTAENSRDFLDRIESVTGRLYGEPLPIDSVADEFALYGLARRAAVLERIDDGLGGEIASGSHSLRRHVQLIELRRKMDSIHHALRNARR
jgi:hypothetical protein